MKKYDTSDFRFLETSREKVLTIQSGRIRECMECFAENDFDGIHIAPFFGFNFPNLDFLKDYPDVIKKIKAISISEEIKDITALTLLTELKSLLIGRKDPKIDFSYFKRLEYLNISGGNNIINLELCKKLNALTIFYYNPKSRDFCNLPPVNWIKELTITNSTVTSLNGLEKFNNLEKASFHLCTKLEKLCCLDNSSDTLGFLEFENCKKINNHTYVTGLNNLKTLAFNSCGSISSFQFLNEMPNLNDIRFVHTNIVDGDLTPVLRLDFAGFLNKRHFSHSREAVKSLFEKRTGKKWPI